MSIKCNSTLLIFLGCIQLSTIVVAAPFNPAYSSFPTKNIEYTLTGGEQIFHIKELKYGPDSKITYLPKSKVKYDSPENAMIARFSALAAEDLSWWRSQWESESQADESLKNLLANNPSEEQLRKRWGSITQNNYVFLINKILYKDYAIITYQVVKKGQSVNPEGMELPVVFKRVGSAWKVSSGLSRSPLLAHSPWKTGNYEVVEKQLWIVQEND